MLAFSAELVRQWDAGRRWIALPLRAALNLLPLAPPLLPMVLAFGSGGAGGQPFGHGWFNWTLKLRWIRSVLRDRTEILDRGSLAVLMLVLVVAAAIWVFRRRRPSGVTLVAASVILLVLFILMPFALLGSAYADMRLAPFLFATALLAISTPQRWTSLLAGAALCFFGARTAMTTMSYLDYNRSFRDELGALRHVPDGARVLGLVGKPCGPDWAVHRLDHLPSMVIVRRHGFSNDQWQAAGAQLLRVTYGSAGRFAADPSQFVIETRCERRERMGFKRAMASFPRAAFDYVWVIQQPREGADMGGLTPVWQSGRSALYRVTTE